MARFRYNDYWLSKSRKKESKKMGKKMVKASVEHDDPRKIRNAIRERMRDPEWMARFNDGVPKLGAFISRAFRSSGRFCNAYSAARSEAEFYDMARYADY